MQPAHAPCRQGCCADGGANIGAPAPAPAQATPPVGDGRNEKPPGTRDYWTDNPATKAVQNLAPLKELLEEALKLPVPEAGDGGELLRSLEAKVTLLVGCTPACFKAKVQQDEAAALILMLCPRYLFDITGDDCGAGTLTGDFLRLIIDEFQTLYAE
jgi:hypothetical protein